MFYSGATILATAILLVVGTVSAQHSLEIPQSAWEKVIEKSNEGGFLKPELYSSHIKLASQASPAQWSECDSQHLYDVAVGTAKPNPPQVGSTVGLNLDVIFNNDANVIGNYVYVQFTSQGATSPISLFAQEYPATEPGQYGAGDEYTDSISWLVPSFAPLGHYKVQISVHGPNRNSDVWACIQCDFDIFN